MTAAVITPVHSQESNDGSFSHDWCSKIQEGMEISQVDWEKFAEEKGDIPLLDRQLLDSLNSTTQMVRVRGMVQDMGETEYYSTSTPASNGDDVTVMQLCGSSSFNLRERLPLTIAPVSFTTDWFRDVLRERSSPLVHRNKRMRLNEDGEEEETIDSSNNDNNNASGKEKETKNSKCDACWWPGDRMKSDPEQVPVLAKLYYDQYRGKERKKLGLNQVVEFVGVIEKGEKDDDAAHQYNIPGSLSSLSLEEPAAAVPSHIPRLHVLWYRPLDIDLMTARTTNKRPTAATAAVPAAPSSPHVLAKVLSIPETPASALWMAMLSMAERETLREEDQSPWTPVQMPNETTLGCASLSIILPDQSDGSNLQNRLTEVLSHVTPVVHTINLTERTLSEIRTPCKKAGRLQPTPLQMPKGSTLILNICQLQPGRLSSEQIETLQSLQHLTQRHRVPYTFDGGVQIPFEADVRVIVLSTANRRRILPCTLQVKCPATPVGRNDGAAAKNTTTADLVQSHSAELLSVRQALANARGGGQQPAKSSTAAMTMSHRNIGLSSAVLENSQKMFVQRRQNAREKGKQQTPSADVVGEDTFHRWLTLTRLHARSRQATEAQVEDWEQALALDDSMILSLQN